jgi:Rrf2 family protein
MHLTQAADYGVRAMIHLASLETGSRMSSTCLARAVGSPEPFLTKVMQFLAAARLVSSRRGNAGGFALAKSPDQISMLDVVEAIEGPLVLNDCTEANQSADQRCFRISWCAAHVVWAQAQVGLRRTLGAALLSDLAADSIRRQFPAAAETIALTSIPSYIAPAGAAPK